MESQSYAPTIKMNSLWTQWLSFTLLLKILISNLDQQVQEEGSIPRVIQVFHKHLVPGSVPAPQDRHRGPPSPLPATIYPKGTLNGAGGTCAPRHKPREGSRCRNTFTTVTGSAQHIPRYKGTNTSRQSMFYLVQALLWVKQKLGVRVSLRFHSISVCTIWVKK